MKLMEFISSLYLLVGQAIVIEADSVLYGGGGGGGFFPRVREF